MTRANIVTHPTLHNTHIDIDTTAGFISILANDQSDTIRLRVTDGDWDTTITHLTPIEVDRLIEGLETAKAARRNA